MKVAIVHYWLVNMRGGEKVLEALCEMYPGADIFTHVYDPSAVSERIRSHRVRTTMIARLPFARRLYQAYLPLMPLALEQLDLREYDLVISSESGPAKGVLTRPDALHVCYCHTPMRYIWNMYLDYKSGAPRLLRGPILYLAHRLRNWDYSTAARVDYFMANSHNVAERISKYYRRPAAVVYPPVDLETFAPPAEAPPADKADGFYLCAGQLLRYKRVDLAIEACRALGRRLVVLGAGSEYEALRRSAGPEVEFLGRVDDATLRSYYARCRALLFTGEEDFGIVPLEAMACGRPVIAYGRGGALETVAPGISGLHFPEQTTASLQKAILRFEAQEHIFDPATIAAHAGKFSKAAFRRAFQASLAHAEESRPFKPSWMQGRFAAEYRAGHMEAAE
ncbi:glycosyltransferase [Teichococcus oryzae]|uniref:Glycosyltransferase family 4 protein n=1 Tax=Teichococcus oryzae TaxID=1608942 RepID=A0A5B2TC17_9PROT|nr:glycosyltransferase [Pseudoroseomonas oryzae]KAA2212041.1 glycosyltransferase family 4 protein [Pseudoroseomonas oryzae]